MRESKKSRQAFDRYVRMGDGRSLVRLRELLVADGVSVGLRTLESWSTRLHWQPRIAEIEREAAAADVRELTEAVREMNERQAKEGLLLQQKGAARLSSMDLAEMDADAAIRALTEGARLERLARGAATDRSDLNHGSGDHRLEQINDDQLDRLITHLEAELADGAAAGTGGPAD